MPTRATVAVSLIVALAVILVTPTAVRYGGIAPWGPWVPGAGGALTALLAVAHSRRPERSRAAFYVALAVAIGCAWFTAWLVVQRAA